MTEFIRINRRLFLARLGKGTLAMAVLGACGDPGATSTTLASTTTGTDPATTSSPTTTGAPSTTVSSEPASFHRVNLGFVSAYIVARGSEAAVVDTGVSGSEAAIETALGTADLSWAEVAHLVLTHHHPDHVGSMAAVLNAATAATGYIGEGDLDNVTSPRQLVAVSDGDEIFGLQVISSPGHTSGHISLFDPVAAVLIAGDALNGDGGRVAGPNPQFSEDHALAVSTVMKLANYPYETIYFGHGEPVMSNGASLVGQLIDSSY
jgi:glyoxylase-like metal-dependent hydrolase (beta-lactamase superfamily II)